jgi:hypothetical protein
LTIRQEPSEDDMDLADVAPVTTTRWNAGAVVDQPTRARFCRAFSQGGGGST